MSPEIAICHGTVVRRFAEGRAVMRQFAVWGVTMMMMMTTMMMGSL